MLILLDICPMWALYNTKKIIYLAPLQPSIDSWIRHFHTPGRSNSAYRKQRTQTWNLCIDAFHCLQTGEPDPGVCTWPEVSCLGLSALTCIIGPTFWGGWIGQNAGFPVRKSSSSNSWLSQTNDLHNLSLWLLVLDINMIGRELVN